MIQPGRKYSATDNYRYGFNGKENDNEIKGEGIQQDYGMRIYDPRLGKFLSVDPLMKNFPFYSPYHFAGSNPIFNIDLDGAEDLPYYHAKFYERFKSKELKNYITQGGNHASMFYFYDGEKKYLVTKISTQETVKDWMGNAHGVSYYFVQDKSLINEDDKMSSDNATNFESGGTNWHFWMTNNDISRRHQVTDDLLNKTGITVFGLAAGGAAAPVIAKIGGTYLGSKLVNTAVDFTSQMISNGGNIKDINLTSLATSFVFNKTTSWKGLLIKNSAASGLQYNSGGGYQGFFGEGVDNSNILYNIGAGTIFDKATVGLRTLNKDVTPSMLGRWKNLSYKPKYSFMLQKYQSNQKISNFINSVPGQIATGTLSNLANKPEQR